MATPTPNPNPSRIRQALLALPVATIVDALNSLGYQRVFMEEVRNLTPGQKLAGRAVTLRFLPFRADLKEETRRGPDSPEYRAIMLCGPGDVLVVEALGLPHGSVGGDIKFSPMKRHGAEGIVTDGAIRDTAAVRAYGLKLFAQNGTARIGSQVILPYEVNGYINCGGVLVKPGDYVVGEDDGVVVIPGPLVEAVVQAAREHEALEEAVLRQIEAEDVSPGKYYPFGEGDNRRQAQELLKRQRG